MATKHVLDHIDAPVLYEVEFEGEKRYVTIPENDEVR
jgi:hypothetical protein